MEIHYVHNERQDMNDPILRKILDYCQLHDMKVTVRNFNPNQYDEDREEIRYLPAIHLYKRGQHEDTFYPDQKPVQFLHREYQKFDIEEMEREAKKQIWEERIRFLRRVFCSLKTDSKLSKIEHL